ncbi:hypothetical protein B0T22DRAFT_243218 [Podospora appendiculata]|uniref:Uncharacterized protein n=1 Tax=Podospora appendiculata TaxID=314037 RepID=A0AAE0X6W8_9PEZI|nr:hypothetical protein B0T22DRAFT_243218 [Podospora appendiculata]
MRLPLLLLAAVTSIPLATAAVIPDSLLPTLCGGKFGPCPTSATCKQLNPLCNPGINPLSTRCLGYCVPSTTTTTTPVFTPQGYQSCGGFRVNPAPTCPTGTICVDDPYAGGCGMACDAPGICVTPGIFCGGIAGFRCPGTKICIDDPRDECSVENGGADCGGICV